MSIWCSWEHIGTDPTVMYEVRPGMYEVDLGDGEQARGREPVPQVAERGVVLSYAEGWSNHYPDLTGEAERPAVIALADVAPWCVPGHGYERDAYVCETCRVPHDHDEPGPWVRLEVEAPEALNFWGAGGVGKVERQGATVVMDEQAARSLRDDLTAWLDRDKVRPVDT